MKLRTLIIDDEPHAREGIIIRLKGFPECVVIGECASGSEALNSIRQLQPDLLFLDIQLPDMDGFEVIQRLDSEKIPLIIFVTAYDQHAIKAFEFHAIDYLLKPVNENRFENAVKFAIDQFTKRNWREYSDKIFSLINDLTGSEQNDSIDHRDSGTSGFISKIVVKQKDNISFVPVNQIDWIESAGDYIYIHSTGKKHLIRDTLVSLEKKLDPRKFLRIHRSSIVNIDKIEKMRANDHGDFEVYLLDGSKLKLSRTYRSNFEKILGNSL